MPVHFQLTYGKQASQSFVNIMCTLNKPTDPTTVITTKKVEEVTCLLCIAAIALYPVYRLISAV